MSGFHIIATESTPLLVKNPKHFGEDDEEISTVHEARVLVGLSIPLMLMNFLR